MHFPQTERLRLPCRFERLVPGALHPDGQRYLPTLVFRLANGFVLGVVDRHHRVDPHLVGREGNAHLVFLLSTLQLQSRPFGQGLAAEPGRASSPSLRPRAQGQVVAVPTWETEHEHLPYQTLYTELLVDIGVGVVGVRTNVVGPNLASKLGKPRLEVGDWIDIDRSRIDILTFQL